MSENKELNKNENNVLNPFQCWMMQTLLHLDEEWFIECRQKWYAHLDNKKKQCVKYEKYRF